VEDWKIRISVLWIFFAVLNSVHYVLSFFEPGALLNMPEMTLETDLFLVMEVSASWLIPLTMAYLTVTVGNLANRRLNLALGGFFTLLGIVHPAICPIVHITDNPSIHQLLLVISTIVISALIFWIAWKSKQKT
jgi:hypothetical protein